MLKDFQARLYQETIFATCTKNNTLVVLPTGIGKTAIFLMLASQRLSLYPKSKILLLGPTRPLIDQYYSVFEKFFNIDKNKLAVFTGFVSPEKRAELWGTAQIIFSTPQGLENDILSGKISLEDVSLIGFDEAHRATGDYAYTFVAKQYMKKASHPKILALTASPGSDVTSIEEVCTNLFIEAIEVRDTDDEDVVPYVQEIDIKKIFVELPDEFIQVRDFLKKCFISKLEEVKKLGYLSGPTSSYSKKNLLGLQAAIHGKISSGEKDYELMKSISLIAEATKIHHALELIETQGIEPLKMYLDKLQEEGNKGKTKAAQNLIRDINFRSAFIKTEKIYGKFEHPKFIELLRIIEEEIPEAEKQNSEKKIMIFSQYRDSGNKITEDLKALGYKAKLFVGQAKKKDTGLTQKKQKEMLDQFSTGEFNILVSSSVGEEGLDIPQVDLVMFYEPVPSAIRKIQRSGRTGRLEKGRIIMLITKDTIDEIYYHVARNKEKRMYRAIDDIQKTFVYKNGNGKNNNSNNNSTNKLTLHDYEEKENTNIIQEEKTKPRIIADYREKGSGVLKELIDKSDLSLEKLEIGDYLLSKRVVVEFKTVYDFVDSILDGRLLQQLKELKRYERPVIIIEGIEDIYSVRKVHPNAIRGMLATISVSYGIPILQTKTSRDTAELLMAIAKREQDEDKKSFTMHYAKPLSLKEQQEYFISALPNIGMGGAKPLLQHFGSVKNIVNASEKELQDADLIGPKKAKSMKEIFDKEYEEK